MATSNVRRDDMVGLFLSERRVDGNRRSESSPVGVSFNGTKRVSS
jgi:hypothetical protein